MERADADEEEKRPTHSVTSLIVYETCPLQYHTTFIRKIPPPITRGMRTGTSIHALIARYFKHPERVSASVDPEIRAMLEIFTRSRFSAAPAAVEQPFVLPFDHADVRGRIDVVLSRPGGGLEVVDFKSGGPRSRDELDRGLQLPLYALAIARRFDMRPDELAYTYYFLREGQEVTFTPSEQRFQQLATRVTGILQAIAEERFDPPPDCDCYACQWDRRWRRHTGRDRQSRSGSSPD